MPSTLSGQPRVLTLSQVAELLGQPEDAVLGLVLEGALRPLIDFGDSIPEASCIPALYMTPLAAWADRGDLVTEPPPAGSESDPVRVEGATRIVDWAADELPGIVYLNFADAVPFTPRGDTEQASTPVDTVDIGGARVPAEFAAAEAVLPFWTSGGQAFRLPTEASADEPDAYARLLPASPGGSRSLGRPTTQLTFETADGLSMALECVVKSGELSSTLVLDRDFPLWFSEDEIGRLQSRLRAAEQ